MKRFNVTGKELYIISAHINMTIHLFFIKHERYCHRGQQIGDTTSDSVDTRFIGGPWTLGDAVWCAL